ncbi:MAG TPA: PQQ-binding-like beta-propeller repeat protein [Gemmatimonadaceae bacterium]|nr:PQQ-binding-like beta-propeller repeat protein [Gemmatimonadaceae bacterium]
MNPADWPVYNRTLAGDRYSPLSEINAANVAGLRTICAYTLPEVTSFQTGPIVVNGTMYFTTDTISYAINASNCAERWRTVRHSETPSQLGVNRGFAYMDGRLFRGTSDVHALALDANDGHVIWDRVLDIKGPGVSLPMAPVAANGLVYIGNAGGDIADVTGHVYALDARDGHVAWKFDVVPASGPARSTWLNPRLPVSGGGFWTSFALDAPNGILYVPAGNPAPDFDAELRRGDNLYTNSVIALSSRSGRLLAWNQLVKHDAHDWDVDSPPVLVTTRSGRAIVASANKDGLLSILDRSRVTHGPSDAASTLTLVTQVPTTTRMNADVPLSRTHVTHFCPGIQGGNEWNGAAYSPQTNSLYAGAVDWCGNVQLKRDTINVLPPPGSYWFGAETPLPQILDPPTQAKGWLTSYDAENGSVRWKFAAPHPMLAAVTPTAGGIVFAADMGGQLYAMDASTGRILWQTNTGQSTGGGIVTYVAGGRQLVGVASGMKSPVWPGATTQSRILVLGLR